MGLALCHKIPRDVFLLIALFFVLVSIVLQCIVVSHHNSPTLVGRFTLFNASQANDVTVAYLAAYPVIYEAKLDVKPICSSSDSLLHYDCARFAESYHVINGLLISSLTMSLVMFIAGALFTTFLGQTTSGLLRRLTTMLCIPTALHCAAVSVFFSQTVPHASATLDISLPVKESDKLLFHRGSLVDLTIAAFSMLGVAFIIVFVRWIFALVTRWRFIHSVSHRREKARKLMALHIINDDWERQQQILRSHASSIHPAVQTNDDIIRTASRSQLGLRRSISNRSTSSSVELSEISMVNSAQEIRFRQRILDGDGAGETRSRKKNPMAKEATTFSAAPDTGDTLARVAILDMDTQDTLRDQNDEHVQPVSITSSTNENKDNAASQINSVEQTTGNKLQHVRDAGLFVHSGESYFDNEQPIGSV